jgi:predicted SAM-dependent methyltransferase
MKKSMSSNTCRLTLLNFGAGDPIPGWFNVDSSPLFRLPRFIHRIITMTGISSRSQYFLRADYKFYFFKPAKKLPFKDRTINIIYCSHVLEHLPAESLGHLFDEFHRVLKQKGIVRVIVPDLETAILSSIHGGTQGAIDIGEHLGTLPRALRSSRFRMMMEALFGFPSFHKTLIVTGHISGIIGESANWRMKQGLHYLESGIETELLKKIEIESRCQGSLIFELEKRG